MIKYIAVFTICLSSLTAFSQSVIDSAAKSSTGIELFNSAAGYLSAGQYKMADSLFTLALEAGAKNMDTYFDRALARQKLGNSCGSCVDMLCAAALGDREANSLFWKNCRNPELTCEKNVRVVIEDTVATITDFDPVSNTKRMHLIRKIKGLSHSYLIHADGKVDTIPLNDSIYDLISLQEPPEFPGGDAEMFSFLQGYIYYPNYEKEHNIQGKVFTTFVVDRDGSVTDVALYKGVKDGEGLTAEALRVVKLMPKWKPGKKDGKNVKVRFILPITFKVQNVGRGDFYQKH